jgi:uncharacterized protein DUF4382/carboxypeptidase family protein
MKLLKIFLKPLILCIAIWALAACGSGGGGTGTLSLGLTDAPNANFLAVYVTIKEVQVHRMGEAEDSENGWITIGTPNRTYNLNDLANGLVEGLGEGPLDAGSYTQLRLIIGDTPDSSPNILCQPHPFANYVIDLSGVATEVKVPSGPQTGIKIVCAGKCNIADNRTTELILDFDASTSITPSFNLKPTIKVLTTEDFTIVSGDTLEGIINASPQPLEGVRVSAQIFDPAAVDPKDQVKIQTATFSAIDGHYELFVRPGDYNLVAYHEGFAPEAVNFTAVAGQTPVVDFTLNSSDTGNVTGLVNIAGVTTPTFVHTSFQEGASLPGEMIEVNSVDTLSGGSYDVNLPVLPTSNYNVVSSTCGKITQVAPINVLAGSDVVLDLNF